MDLERVEFFKGRYSRMRDEELANLLIDRHERLSEEANVALTAVLEKKNVSEFMNEINEKVNDLNRQVQAAREVEYRQRQVNRQIARAVSFVMTTAIGILALSMFVRGVIN